MKKIEINDYLLMSCDETDKTRIVNEFFKSKSVTFIEYFEFLLNGGFDELENQLLSHMGLKNWPRITDDDVVCSILPKSEIERINKRKNKDYYIANGYCAITILKQIFTKNLYDSVSRLSSVHYQTYFQILNAIMCDIDQLKNLYNIEIMNDNKYFATVNRPIHAMELHNVLRQAAYGNISFHSFADFEISASIAVIRQIIELRIRRAFGVLAYYDEHNSNIHPLKMSKVFEILKRYTDISFPNKLCYIERIYQWSNLYVHSGKCDWAWIIYFLERYLRTLSFGTQKANGNWSYCNGITVSKETLEKIQNDIGDLNPEFKLLKCDPECEIN